MMEFQSVWAWAPAVYLFLGGLGSGLFIAAALLYFFAGKRGRKTTCVAAWVAVGCLAVGLMLLASDTTNFLRSISIFQSFRNTRSWMTFGAWSLMAALLFFGLFALCSTPRFSWMLVLRFKVPTRILANVRRTLAALGGAAALCVMSYTGFLLNAASGIPFWNSWLLVVLFVITALISGLNTALVIAVATNEFQAPRRHTRHILGMVFSSLALVEAIILTAFLSATLHSGADVGAVTSQGLGAFLAAKASAQSILNGEFAPWFWTCAVGCGIVTPTSLSLFALMSKRYRQTPLMFSCVCAVVGEFALRVIILFAGMHTDWMALTLLNLF